MAALGPAERRIRYLITGSYPYAECRGWEKGSPQSPSTISGSSSEIRSYAMPIAWRDGEDWIVTNEWSSATTNRHIRAAHDAMEAMGYVKVAEETVPITRRRPYSFFATESIPVTRYTKGKESA